jgi:16S rRNA (guanine(1405)-N(7))-methyltransferase
VTESELALADWMTVRILASAKYRSLDQSIVRRVAAEAAQRFGDRNQAVKYARRKLHQAFGAFLSGSPARAVTEAVAAVRSGRSDLRTAAVSAMRAHASAAERASWLAPFYDQVAAWCGSPGSVADLACGLNPLAIPWMRLSPGASYWACEIDADLVAALADLGQIMPVRLTAVACDLVSSCPAPRADVALLLKTVTTIEQQHAGAAGRLLAGLDCRHVIVSLPRRSLSGRRGYRDDTGALIQTMMSGSRYRLADQAAFGNELLCHFTAGPGAVPSGPHHPPARRRAMNTYSRLSPVSGSPAKPP